MIGVVLFSFTIIIFMVFILETFQGNVYIEGALTGIKATVTGSIFFCDILAERLLAAPMFHVGASLKG